MELMDVYEVTIYTDTWGLGFGLFQDIKEIKYFFDLEHARAYIKMMPRKHTIEPMQVLKRNGDFFRLVPLNRVEMRIET